MTRRSLSPKPQARAAMGCCRIRRFQEFVLCEVSKRSWCVREDALTLESGLIFFEAQLTKAEVVLQYRQNLPAIC